MSVDVVGVFDDRDGRNESVGTTLGCGRPGSRARRTYVTPRLMDTRPGVVSRRAEQDVVTVDES